MTALRGAPAPPGDPMTDPSFSVARQLVLEALNEEPCGWLSRLSGALADLDGSRPSLRLVDGGGKPTSHVSAESADSLPGATITFVS